MHRAYLPGSLLALTLISFCLLSSLPISADDSVVSNVRLSVPVSCNMTSTVDTPHTATINPGTYRQNIGTTTFNVLCNDPNGFALYAIGYTDNVYGNNKLTATINGAIDHSYDISTSTATSGDTSSWAMKLTPVAGTTTPTIENSYNDYNVIPTQYTKVANFTSATDPVIGASVQSTYASYMSTTQHTGTYDGKVKYTLVHPNNTQAPGYAYLDTGRNINMKLKSLASGTNVTNASTNDTLITAFVRSNTLPANFTPTTENTISLSTSPAPVYVWFDSVTGTIYYYSESEIINVTLSLYMTFYNMKSLTNISGLSDWNTSAVTSMGTMFDSTQISDLTPLTNWNVSNVTGMSSMFSHTQISDLTPLTNWKVDNVTGMSFMFYSTQISDLTPLTNWKVDNVTNMDNMFSRTQISDLALLANWKVDNVTNMRFMFSSTGISDLTPLTNWRVDNVTDMGGMFSNTQISDLTPITDWNVGNVTSMDGLFRNTKVSDLSPVASWDTSNVLRMDSLFEDSLISDITPLINWNVSKVINMEDLFRNTKISDLTPITDWNVGNVTSMSGMFYTTNISNISPLSSWQVGKVEYMSWMFYGTKLTSIAPLANWNTSNVTSMFSMFAAIPNLADGEVIKNWDVSKVKIGGTACKTSINSLVSTQAGCFYAMFGYSTPKTNLPIFTSRPGTWDTNGTYIPNP